jgi:hypothetical protein
VLVFMNLCRELKLSKVFLTSTSRSELSPYNRQEPGQ